MRIGKPFRNILQNGSKLPAPPGINQTSNTTKRNSGGGGRDGRYGERTGRKDYYGVRVRHTFKTEMDERCARLTVERVESGRTNGKSARVTQGEMLEIMGVSYDLLGEVGPEERKLLEKIAARMSIGEDEVFQTLIAEKGRALGIIDDKGDIVA